MTYTTTLKRLRENDACRRGYDLIADHVGREFEGDNMGRSEGGGTLQTGRDITEINKMTTYRDNGLALKNAFTQASMDHVVSMMETARTGAHRAPVRVDVLPGRNDPCPCGSGRKFKKCCIQTTK